MGIFNPGEMGVPEGGISGSETPESHLHVLVDPLCLAVRLGVIS